MDDLRKQIDDTLMSIAEAKKFMFRLEKTEKLREALNLGKQGILYNSVLLYTITCLACKTDEALTQAGFVLSRGWRLSDMTLAHLISSTNELSKQMLRINRQNLVFF